MEKKNSSNDIILNSIADGVFTVDRDWKITSFNKAAESITRISKEEAIGQNCCDIFKASICERGCVLRETLKTGQQVINRPIYIINSDGETVPISISTALLKDKDGDVIGGVETFRDLSVEDELRRRLEKKYSHQDIIGKNNKVLEIFDILPSIAESESTVLIEGESGVGKELFARAIHNLSPRKKKPLITINCGALPDTLLESELFGYKAGAFTDARKDKPGRFALGEGGTVFLDEIGDISPALQVRLLRVLQEKTYEPLGGTEPIKANVRIIAATNKNLERLIKNDLFREDLYYRINVIKVKLPPLRERTEDIPLLVNHFISRFNKLKRKLITGISPEVLSILMNHNFPGNIRELENIIEHAFILNRSGRIEIKDLPENLRPIEDAKQVEIKSIDDIEAQFIIE
ncbi:MAG: PAS domain-containing protein, partial [candidate division Zixibacteria bacterium]|nr:PAS domain-containing protein [candidate division Zixibacteria bacterium]